MEQFWQVCELEDNSLSFTVYTVAAMPEIWIVRLEDGTYICYWHKVNPAKKIREFMRPNEGGIWMTYKCRILMKEEKFSSYDEARKAEKYCENFSLKEDSSEEEVSENVRDCNSTMDFEVSEVLDDDEMFIGNDSYNFNKANLMGGLYCSTKLKFTIEDDSYSSDESVGEKKPKIDIGDSDVSTYSDFLTSTLLPKALKSIDSPKVLAKITFIETNISSFVNDIKKDLDELKELVHSRTEKSEDDVQNVQDMTSQSDQAEINVSPRAREKINQTKEYGTASPHERITPECDVLSFPSPKVKILRVEMLNEPLSNVLILSNAITPITGVEVPKDLSLNDETVKQPMLKFPIPRKEDYYRNEDLLDEANVGITREDALIKHLLPYDNEDEVQYMNRTILTVFTETFFVDSVSFKPEKDDKRLLITGTNILNCWKASFETKFGPDDKNKKFQKHFRRFKSAKRAGTKRAEADGKTNVPRNRS